MVQDAASRRRVRGDWQTPPELASDLVDALAAQVFARWGEPPATVVEPTCGGGVWLEAAADRFPMAALVGVDRSHDHLALARARLPPSRTTLLSADAFTADWRQWATAWRDPVLVLGNPPWVTASTLGLLAPNDSSASPVRMPQAGWLGLDNVLGRSNFDVSHWLWRVLLAALAQRRAAIALLSKTSVARKVLEDVWTSQERWHALGLWRIDASASFRVAASAGLLALLQEAEPPDGALACPVYSSPVAAVPHEHWGSWRGRLVPDAVAAARTARWESMSPAGWRSGIKHDCAAVFELVRDGAGFKNALGETADVEPELVYPLAKGGLWPPGAPARWLLVPQRSLGAERPLADTAPRAAAYLARYSAHLERRRSPIYRGKAAFAVFGVGPYSFAPWKIAAAGLRWPPRFTLLSPVEGRPVVVDDTAYTLGFEGEEEARRAFGVLASPGAEAYFAARAFPDAKRPVTKVLLDSFDETSREGEDGTCFRD